MSPQPFPAARMATVIGMTEKRPLIMTVFRACMERLLNHLNIFDVVSMRRGESISNMNMQIKMAAKAPTLMGISSAIASMGKLSKGSKS